MQVVCIHLRYDQYMEKKIRGPICIRGWQPFCYAISSRVMKAIVQERETQKFQKEKSL